MSDTPRTDRFIDKVGYDYSPDASYSGMRMSANAVINFCRQLELALHEAHKANADLRRELDEIKSKLEVCEYDFKDIVDRE